MCFFLAVWRSSHSNGRLGSHAIARLSSFKGGWRSSAGIGLQVFLEPMMGVRFVVEGVDFDISFLAVQCLGLGQGPIRFQMKHCKSCFPGKGLKRMENFACNTPPACG